MSNPKVFEFAKEIGMTPLALMDKIREWNLPVKSHMAELEPTVLEQIKIKLSGGERLSEEAKPKKTVAKKAAPKKVVVPEVEVQAAAGAAKAPVIRRKKEEEAPRAKIISRPEVVESAPIEEQAVARPVV